MNLHLRVSDQLYKELRELSDEFYCEGSPSEFCVIPMQLFVSSKGDPRFDTSGSLYVGNDSTELSHRMTLTGKEV